MRRKQKFIFILVSFIAFVSLAFVLKAQTAAKPVPYNAMVAMQNAWRATEQAQWETALKEIEWSKANWDKMKVYDCGNAAANGKYARDMIHGAALEGLGRTKEAAKIYWTVSNRGPISDAEARIVALYDAADQLDALQNILNEIQRRDEERLIKNGKNPADYGRQRVANYEKRISMLKAAKAKRWDELIQELRPKFGRPSTTSWKSCWEPLEAARLLAQSPEETVPLIIADLDRLQGDDAIAPNWHDLALGMAGTEGAIVKLKERASSLPLSSPRDSDSTARIASLTFVHIVQQAKAPGEKWLSELSNAKLMHEPLANAVSEWKQNRGREVDDPEKFSFPPIKENAELPLTYEEVFGIK